MIERESRTPNAGRKRRPGRGLPSVEALCGLARTYLEAQRAHWPELAAAGLLPPPGPGALDALAEGFRSRFLGAEAGASGPPAEVPPQLELAGSYLRYSDENSNPRSLDQQLNLQLARARQDGRFIPWAYVFADAAVTGTTADRRGYALAKLALGHGRLATLYIDEIGRASRDAVEALRLGRLVERHGKRLVGVSDGFDSSAQFSKMQLSMYAMVQEWFVDQLRSKVHRGMDDAFGRGTNLQPPSLGYTLVPAVDAEGRPLHGADGERLRMKAVDAGEVPHVLEAFRLYGEQGWSRGRVARLLNERSVGDSRTWDSTSVGQLLRRHTYVGIEVYRMTHQVRDPETGRVSTYRRPRKDWQVRRVRELQIVPWSLWKLVRSRLAACRASFARQAPEGTPSRAATYPTVLFRPICGACGSELMLGRAGKYASYCCRNAISGKRGCAARGYKALAIVEGAILGHLAGAVFTPEFLGSVLAAANRSLAEAAARPRGDAGPLEAEVRSARSQRDRLVKLLEVEGEADLGAVVAQVRRHERRLAELRGRLDAMRALDAPPPPTLSAADLGPLLGDLRGLLAMDVAAAAPILRELTGPITVEQIAEEGRSKPTWVARFAVDAAPVLARLAAARGCPNAGTWEYLNTGDWMRPGEVEVRLELATKAQLLAARAAEMAASGASVETTARALGTTWATARAALDAAETGGAPPPSGAPRAVFGGPEPKYVRLAEEVARLHGEEGLPFTKVAEALGICHATATRAWDHAHRPALAEAAGAGQVPERGRRVRRGDASRREVLGRLRAGEDPKAVAAAVGCSRQTVRRVMLTMAAV